jgi:hypothetical protein
MPAPRQVFPDTYSVPVRIQAKRPNTNPRYRHYCQTHYTAGDVEQFEQALQLSECRSGRSTAPVPASWTPWQRYALTPEATRNTFQYVFRKFKKGIFVQIRDGQVVTFLPFSNAFFVNEWSDRVRVPDALHQDPTVLPVHQWYTNNGLFRYESPCNETDTGVCQMKNLFETLCREYPRDVPDLNLFINRRDFPLLKQDLTEPYDHIYDRTDHPLVSHAYAAYAPVLSACVTEGFADLPIPTMDDWTRVQYKEGVHFASTKRAMATDDTFSTPWSRKREYAVFRGTSTGIGYDARTNPRIRLCTDFQTHPRCNVGLTAWNTRYRKYTGSPELRQIEPTMNLSGPLTADEQSQYKYIIHVEGHVQAYRLGVELAMRSVILLVHSRYRLWYEPLLQPWVHYVPVAEDLSDLNERLEWCVTHDAECQEIAHQARVFYDTHLSRKGCLQYLHDLCWQIARTYGNGATTSVRIPRPWTQRYLQQHLLRERITTEMSSVFTQRRVLFQNPNSTVTLYASSTQHMYVHKTASRALAKYDHEQFVGVFAINPLLQHIPNFVFTLPVRQNRGIYLEYVQGKSLFDYLKSPMFQLNEWLFYVIQTVLAVGVGQRLCFLTHHDLCPWNVLLRPTAQREEIVDYLLEPGVVYRIYTSCVPVIIDYDKSHVVHDLQQFVHFFGYDTYQDALCLLVSSLYNILRFQHTRLRPADVDRLVQIARDTIVDPVYCPRLETVEDLRAFLDDAHRYAHLSFTHKGALSARRPRDLIPMLLRHFRPYAVQGVWQTCERVDSVQYRSLHFLRPNPLQPDAAVHPLLQLYWKQRQTSGLPDEYEIRDEPILPLPRLYIPRLDGVDVETLQNPRKPCVFVLPRRYLQVWNMLVEMVADGGPYQLLPEEKQAIAPYLETDLNTRERLLAYSRSLIKFKLSRNIL